MARDEWGDLITYTFCPYCHDKRRVYLEVHYPDHFTCNGCKAQMILYKDCICFNNHKDEIYELPYYDDITTRDWALEKFKFNKTIALI